MPRYITETLAHYGADVIVPGDPDAPDDGTRPIILALSSDAKDGGHESLHIVHYPLSGTQRQALGRALLGDAIEPVRATPEPEGEELPHCERCGHDLPANGFISVCQHDIGALNTDPLALMAAATGGCLMAQVIRATRQREA